MSYTTTALFNASLSQGAKGEYIMASYLRLLGYRNIKKNTSKVLSLLKEWDLKADMFFDTIYFEIKTDLYEYYNGKITNNMFIETRCGGKPSGIDTSLSDFLIYYYPEHEVAYSMRISDLRRYLAETSKHLLSSGGDSGAAWGYLINRFDLETGFSKWLGLNNEKSFFIIEGIPNNLFIKKYNKV